MDNAKNIYKHLKNYTIGYTNKGEKFFIDTEDYNKIKGFNWRTDKYGYLVSHEKLASGKYRTILMHRYIMDLDDPKQEISHRDDQRYNNRKRNLRISTRHKNSLGKRNVRGYTKTYNGKYQAKIQYDGERIIIGTFETIEEARFAYIEKAVELFGEYCLPSIRDEYEMKLCEKLKKEDKIRDLDELNK